MTKGLLASEIETLLIAASVMPIYGLMLWLGTHGFRLASETTFRRIAYLVIALAAILSRAASHIMPGPRRG